MVSAVAVVAMSANATFCFLLARRKCRAGTCATRAALEFGFGFGFGSGFGFGFGLSYALGGTVIMASWAGNRYRVVAKAGSGAEA